MHWTFDEPIWKLETTWQCQGLGDCLNAGDWARHCDRSQRSCWSHTNLVSKRLPVPCLRLIDIDSNVSTNMPLISGNRRSAHVGFVAIACPPKITPYTLLPAITVLPSAMYVKPDVGNVTVLDRNEVVIDSSVTSCNTLLANPLSGDESALHSHRRQQCISTDKRTRLIGIAIQSMI